MKKAERIAITVIVVAICLWFSFPTLKWYLFTTPQDKALVSYSSEQIRDYAKSSEDETASRQKIQNLKKLSSSALQLGLDLKGGMSILLDVDKAGFEERLGHQASEAELAEAIDLDIEILKNRIDQYGVSEPEIRKQGSDQILIELAGIQDPDRIEAFLRGKGSLSFHLADSLLTSKVSTWFSENPQAFTPEGLSSCPVLDNYPEWMAVGSYESDEYGIDNLIGVYVVARQPAIDGNYLLSSEYSKDNMGQSIVALHFSDEGGSIFYDFTKANVGKPLAIVMDSKVRSVATIKQAIGSDVSISGFSQQEAQDLAVLLKTANLPISVSISSQQTVGATLGEDTVSSGVKAMGIGFILVVVFMIIIYGLSGLVADIALLLNLVMIISTLSGLGSTITLTGIAGIILTLGMAVDANVIIFERIIEEHTRENLLPSLAVKEGFSKALWTILDGNITTIIAAVVLIIFGSSAVKGFATTLAIGLVSSLFTSLFVSHLLLDMVTSDEKRLHMGLRIKGGKR